MEKKCPICNKLIKVKNNTCCSRKCSYEYRKFKNHTTYTCTYCKKSFDGFKSNIRKYCSRECSIKDRIGKKSPKKIDIIKECLNCNSTFITNGRAKNKKFCNHKCYSDYSKKKKTARRKKLFESFNLLLKTIDIDDFNFYYVLELLGTYRIEMCRIIKEFSNKNWKDYLIDVYGYNIKENLLQFKSAEVLFMKLEEALSKFGKREKTFIDFVSDRNKHYRFDWYSNELKLVIEYNGLQHYVADGLFNKNRNDLLTRIKRDNIKKEFCIDNNIRMIEWPFNLSFNNNNINTITNAILTNQQPSSDKLYYKKVSEKVQRLMDESITSIIPTRAPETQFINFGS